MYAFIQGTVEDIEQDRVSVNCGGVGYEILTTNTAIGKCAVGQAAKFYTYLAVREDALTLYGFLQKDEKEMFLRLIGVSGVGAKAAQAILSANTPESLSLAIMSGNEKALTAAPGIGKKIAQRVIMELKDKFSGGAVGDSSFGSSGAYAPAAASGGDTLSDAAAALGVLGYGGNEIAAALKGLDIQNLSVEDIVRQGLKKLMK